MSRTKYKYISLASVFILCILMLFNWFIIEAVGTKEAHSFLTIPNMLNDGADFLTQLGGKMIAVVVLILSAVLEYLCILSSALGIWGVIRSLINKRKSRLIYVSQLLALFLISIALIGILLISVLSHTMLGDAVSILPTLYLIFALLALIVSFAASAKYPEDEAETR